MSNFNKKQALTKEEVETLHLEKMGQIAPFQLHETRSLGRVRPARYGSKLIVDYLFYLQHQSNLYFCFSLTFIVKFLLEELIKNLEAAQSVKGGQAKGQVDSIAADVCRQLESTNIKLLAVQTNQKETKEAYNAQAIVMEKMATEFMSLRDELSVAQDNAKGIESNLSREREKLPRVEEKLRQTREKLFMMEGNLKSTKERVQSATFEVTKAKESLQRIQQWEKLYQEEVIVEYRQSKAYTQALKDAASDYFKEGALHLRSCLEEQGVVAYYFIFCPLRMRQRTLVVCLSKN
ncbi:hypothetical protein NE237_006506 [Protea cynaroides]|uniref:Uncharacterized protein n=1 Tax=Protea cynaroides TaxID=273540 RepID=A0A9Q0QVI2_9MAGN|nr:hypothetical protein NE237_006506 [Protea cynaroides]